MNSPAVDFTSSTRCCTRISSMAIFVVMAARVAAIVWRREPACGSISAAPLSSPPSAALAHLALKSRQDGANEGILQDPQNRLPGARLRALQAAGDVGLGRHLPAGVFEQLH